MQRQKSVWQWWLKRFGYLLVATLLITILWGRLFTQAESADNPPAWAQPSSMALKRVGAIGAQSEPFFFSNLDCTLMTYRLVAGSQMLSGCFSETAFGLLDSDTSTVIFNGTDEGLPLRAYAPHQILAPWPGALNLATLDAVSTGGSYLSMYKNPLAVLQDQRNPSLQLTAKQLTAPPDLLLKDVGGQRLVINAQTMAFSDGGAWLVAETLKGYFLRINLTTLDMTAFAPAYGHLGSPGLLKSQVAISDDGRYVAIGNNTAAALKVYDLADCGAPPAGVPYKNCRYHEYRPFIQSQVGELRTIRHLRFVNRGLLSFEVISHNPSHDGLYQLAPRDKIESLADYVGLGDSYTAGEGAFDYRAGTDEPDNLCHLSVHSYPLRLSRGLYSARGGHSVACSGAVINDVGSTSQAYRGQVRGAPDFQSLQKDQPALLAAILANFMPGYLAQQRFVGHYQPRVVTASIGGNDIGFGDILKTCVAPRLSHNNCFDSYEDRREVTDLIDQTVPVWVKLFKQLRVKMPEGRLYAIGYPQIAKPGGNCALNVRLSQAELEFAAGLTAYLNDAIRQAAEQAAVTYIDISQALTGHRLCETGSHNLAVNGATAGKDGKVLGLAIIGRESYHPNALGHQLIEQAILKQTRNLTTTPSGPAPAVNNQLLNQPKSGRPIISRLPAPQLTSQVIKKGQAAEITVSGVAYGLRANSPYNVKLDGSSGRLIGSVSSDAYGDINGSVNLPDNVEPGGHTIDLVGENQAGQPIYVTQPVYVPISDHDADGDGAADQVDSCPSAVNSDQDADHDGLDDICDPLIASSPPDNAVAITSNQPPASQSGGSSSPSLTTIANFTVGKRPGAQLAQSSTGRALGTSTVSPSNPRKRLDNVPSRQSRAQAQPPPTALPRLHVLTWLVIPIVAWLVLVAGLYLKHWVPKRRRLDYN